MKFKKCSFWRLESAHRLRFCVSFAELLANLHRDRLVLQGDGPDDVEILLSRMVRAVQFLFADFVIKLFGIWFCSIIMKKLVLDTKRKLFFFYLEFWNIMNKSIFLNHFLWKFCCQTKMFHCLPIYSLRIFLDNIALLDSFSLQIMT